MDSDACVNCKLVMYDNPTLVLLKTDCLHLVCDTCAQRSLATHEQFACGACGAMVGRDGLRRPPSGKTMGFEKEKRKRQTLAKVFNRRPKDFETAEQWEDWCEWVEDITFNLVTGVETERMERIVERYKKEHQVEIAVRNQELEEEKRRYIQQDQSERRLAKQRELEQKAELKEEKEARELERLELQNKLERGQLDAEALERREQEIKDGAPVMKRKRVAKLAEDEDEQVEAPVLQYVPAGGGMAGMPRPVNAHSMAHVLQRGQKEIIGVSLDMSAAEEAKLVAQGPAAGYTPELETQEALRAAFDKLFLQ